MAADVKAGPARRIFRKGDVILEVNGVQIETVASLNDAVNTAEGYWQFSVNRNGRVIRMQIGG